MAFCQRVARGAGAKSGARDIHLASLSDVGFQRRYTKDNHEALKDNHGAIKIQRLAVGIHPNQALGAGNLQALDVTACRCSVSKQIGEETLNCQIKNLALALFALLVLVDVRGTFIYG